MSTIDISDRRSESPQGDHSEGSEGSGGNVRRSSAAPPEPRARRKGLGLLTGLLAIALLVALGGLGLLLGEREALRGEVASLTTALDEARASRAEARETLDGVADQLLALHGTLSSLLQEAVPAETTAAAGAADTSLPAIPTPAEDPDYWHDRALELAR